MQSVAKDIQKDVQGFPVVLFEDGWKDVLENVFDSKPFNLRVDKQSVT